MSPMCPPEVVRYVPFDATPDAREVGSDHMKTGLAQRRDLVPPRVRELGKAVQQQDDGRARGARLEAEQADAVGDHEPAAHVPDPNEVHPGTAGGPRGVGSPDPPNERNIDA